VKVTKIKDGFKQAEIKALATKLNELRRELFTVRLNAATAHVKDYSQYKKLRRNIARALTYLRHKAS